MKQLLSSSQTIERQDIDLLLLLGYNYFKSNKLLKAIIIYKALYHLFPNAPIFGLCLSHLYLKVKKYEEALFYVDTYLTHSKGKQKHGHLIKSKVLFKMGLVQEAKACARNIFI